MAFEKGSDEFNMFSEFWALCKNYWLLIDDDEWWDEVTSKLNEFCKSHGNDYFARDLSMALLNRLERQQKEQRGQKQ